MPPSTPNAVLEAAPSRKVRVNPRALPAGGFASEEERLDVPTSCQTEVSSPNAPLIFNLTLSLCPLQLSQKLRVTPIPGYSCTPKLLQLLSRLSPAHPVDLHFRQFNFFTAIIGEHGTKPEGVCCRYRTPSRTKSKYRRADSNRLPLLIT